jgi:hypothetical protein
MTSFVVETYVPDGDPERFAADVDGIRAAVDSVLSVARRVQHVRSYLVPSDEMGFHVIRADNAEDIVTVTALARIEVERIVAAIGVGPDETDISPGDGGIVPKPGRPADGGLA